MTAREVPSKSHRVPKAWEHNPTGFWRHVQTCPTCAMYYEAPRD